MEINIKEKLVVGKGYTNEEIIEIFNCLPQGGMRLKDNELVVISQRDNHENAHSDYWIGDILYLSGMGLLGDQDMNAPQNKALAESGSNGVNVHLFEMFTDKKFTYRGLAKLAGEPFTLEEKDIADTLRKIIKFPLSLIEKDLISDDKIKREHQELEGMIKRMDDCDLSDYVAKLDGAVRHRNTCSITFEKNFYVSEYAKRRSRGLCELCGSAAPFLVSSRPFQKIFYVKPLSEGGLDLPDNAAAVCPNCYEKLKWLRSPADLARIEERVAENRDRFEKSFVHTIIEI